MRDGGGGRCAHCGAARIGSSFAARRAEARNAIGGWTDTSKRHHVKSHDALGHLRSSAPPAVET